MVDFRRWILALAILSLFAGLASAQVSTNNFLCSSNQSTVNQLRAEGLTEQTGDIVLSCTGGTPTAAGAAIPTVNISIFLNTNVTSRLFPTTAAPTASEALLLIDDPGAPIAPVVAGFGPAAPQNLCATPATGCAEFATVIGGVTVATDTVGGTVAGRNVFQGIVNPDGIHPNLVTFFGIPILPPGTANSRVIRITNIRANASVFGGTVGSTQQIIAQIAVSIPSAVPITNSIPVVGLVQSGLTASVNVASGAVLSQCTGVSTPTSVATLSFSERFASAFKTRLDAGSNTTGLNQNVPGANISSESNFVFPVTGGTAGLADSATRLKAIFHNVPTGVTISVSTASTNSAASGGTAVLVASETGVDAGPVTALASGALTVGSDGTATAVWEVTSTNPGSLDTLTFSVTTTFPASTPPATTPATVNLSFAPTPPAFTAAAGILASSTLNIPRFVDLNAGGGGTTIFNISVCHTILLYPFVTNAPGFDTGIAIANTSSDPFGTPTQAGTCTLQWFTGATNPPNIVTPSVAAGTVFSMVMSANSTLAGFTGYMIASCNFQYAHGFAFISDLGTRNFAMGYLALVVPDPSTTGGHRLATPGAQGVAGSGESNSQ